MINEKMYALGSKRSVIREIFEYGKKRIAEVGKEIAKREQRKRQIQRIRILTEVTK